MSGDSWDDAADGWDDDSAVRAYSHAAFDSLVGELDRRHLELAGMRVLDFGCGTGLLTEKLVNAVSHVDAVDIAPKMLAVLGNKIAERGWSNVATSTSVPPEGSWDLIVCSSVLSFVDDHPVTVADLASRLAPAGLFVHWDWEVAPSTDGPTDEHGMLRSAAEAALRGAGLADVVVRTGFSIPFEDQRMEPLMGSGVSR